MKYLNVKDFGAKGDVRTVHDGHIDNTTPNLLNSSTANFTPNDIGKTIGIGKAGAGGTALKTTINHVNNTTQVILLLGASNTVIAADVMWGTDDSRAVQ